MGKNLQENWIVETRHNDELVHERLLYCCRGGRKKGGQDLAYQVSLAHLDDNWKDVVLEEPIAGIKHGKGYGSS